MLNLARNRAGFKRINAMLASMDTRLKVLEKEKGANVVADKEDNIDERAKDKDVVAEDKGRGKVVADKVVGEDDRLGDFSGIWGRSPLFEYVQGESSNTGVVGTTASDVLITTEKGEEKEESEKGEEKEDAEKEEEKEETEKEDEEIAEKGVEIEETEKSEGYMHEGENREDVDMHAAQGVTFGENKEDDVVIDPMSAMVIFTGENNEEEEEDNEEEDGSKKRKRKVEDGDKKTATPRKKAAVEKKKAAPRKKAYAQKRTAKPSKYCKTPFTREKKKKT